MATLAEIRAKLQQSSQQVSTGDNQLFPHWNIKENETTTIRFLPDGDLNSTFFWVEKLMIKLPFAGIKGETNSKPVTVQVPCMEMYGEACPILTEVRPWFKTGDKNLEEMGKKYWKKKSYLFQGFVVDSKLQEDKAPENPIRRFIMSSQIFNIVKNALLDPEIEELPTDYVRGLDFKITKTVKGKYADYSTSNWARRERALAEDEQAAIEKYGLFNLKDFLPKKPGEVELKVIKEMFEASVDGEAFDMERWGQYFKPNGVSGNSTTTDAGADTGVSTSKVSADVEDDDDIPEIQTPKVTTSGNDAKDRASDILAMIRSRQPQQ